MIRLSNNFRQFLFKVFRELVEVQALPVRKMMSIRELIPSLGKELDELRARVASLEGLFGVGGVSAQKSSGGDRSCSICGISWQLGVACFPQHMVGKRHKGNLEKLSNIPPPSTKVLSPSSHLHVIS